MTTNKASWYYLPAEVRILVLKFLLQDGCSIASFATVSREWQTIIEPHNFARIKLTSSRLANFGSIIHRNRALVRYIWLCLEFQEYDCTRCTPETADILGVSNTDNNVIITVFQELFSTLSTWEPSDNSDLLLDISVHSPSDSEHWFKYLTFRPDVPSDECEYDRCKEWAMLTTVDDPQHGWVAGRQVSAPKGMALYRLFDEIMDDGPFDDYEQENRWWQQLPSVPAVTGVLLRQQNRRRWKPKALAQMFARLPRLREIHYEPWREWLAVQQPWTDQSSQTLFESLTSNQLRRLVLFENFNQHYQRGFFDRDRIRIPSPNISRAVANVSLGLEHLSASFMVDASYFFLACKSSWIWPNLSSLALTSQLLTPDENPAKIDIMLQEAAAAAMKMPNLKTMEIWNGGVGLAILFRYEPSGDGRPAVITWRGTWDFTLRYPVIQAWEAVAAEHRSQGSVIVVKDLLNAASIRSHADAIHYLKLLTSVIRPVSLWQIKMEHLIREGVHN